MNEIVRVVVDAMGGDNAPGEIVKGAVAAANKHEDIHLILTGLKDAVENELKKYTYPADRIEVVPTTQVIETAEPPVAAICICLGRKHRCRTGRWTGDRRKNQRD